MAGVHHTELADGKHGERIAWVVRRMEIDFLSPARIDDILTVDTRTDRHFRRAHLHGADADARR